MNKLTGNPPPQPCFCYSKQNHKTSNCYFKDATCKHCGKKGHISKVCHSASSKKPTQSSQKKQWHKAKATKWVGTDQTTESESDANSEPLAIDKIDGRSSHPITV